MKSTRFLRWMWPLYVLCGSAMGGCAGPTAGMDKEVKPADLEALKATGAKAAGLVVWTSARDGLPHIYTMKTDGSEQRQLTKGDTTDWYPRFSPDGRKILFTRSRERGFVREADAGAEGVWDVYTVDVDGGGLTNVAENAVWGSWCGPDEIIFLRGTKIMRKKLGGEAEKKILDTSRYPMFEGVVVQQPELSHDGHVLALTLTGRHREAGLWNIKKKTWTEMGQGAQIDWAPDGASVYWVDDAGKEGERIAREPVIAGVPADDRDPDKILMVDLHGKRSRERFPRLSADGKWLVFGAAINDLEDDIEDFELFLWEVGSPAGTATRLTFNTANDSWPDIFVGAPAARGKDAEEAKQDASEGAKAGESGEKAAAAPEGEGAKNETAESPAEAAPPEDSAGNTASPPAATKAKKKKKHH